MISTSREQIINRLTEGDRRLKRVALYIRSKKNMELTIDGYALVNELNENLFAFFCTTKFAVDEDLQINLSLSGNDLEYDVRMSHINEQISSGRIMKSLPTEDTPFTGRKFYRCFGKVLVKVAETVDVPLIVDAPLSLVPSIEPEVPVVASIEPEVPVAAPIEETVAEVAEIKEAA